MSRTDSHNESETAAPLADAGGAAVQVPPRGVEETISYTRKPGGTPDGDTISDTAGLGGHLSGAAIPRTAWKDIPHEVREQLEQITPAMAATIRSLLADVEVESPIRQPKR